MDIKLTLTEENWDGRDGDTVEFRFPAQMMGDEYVVQLERPIKSKIIKEFLEAYLQSAENEYSENGYSALRVVVEDMVLWVDNDGELGV